MVFCTLESTMQTLTLLAMSFVTGLFLTIIVVVSSRIAGNNTPAFVTVLSWSMALTGATILYTSHGMLLLVHEEMRFFIHNGVKTAVYVGLAFVVAAVLLRLVLCHVQTKENDTPK